VPPFLGRGTGSPSGTMWLGSRPISVPSRPTTLIHPAVWPQLNRHGLKIGGLCHLCLPPNFNGFLALASLLRLTEVNQTAQCLAVSWAGTLYIHFLGLLPLRNFVRSGAKFPLRPSLALSYIGSVATLSNRVGHYIFVLLLLLSFFFSSIGSVTARHSPSRFEPRFVEWYKECN